MAPTRTPPDEYTIDTPGFDQKIFTGSSTDSLTLPAAVRFAMDRNSVLQSAADAVAFRIAAHDTEYAKLGQATRTTAMYFRADKQYVVAFDDHPDPAQNILLARAQEGYDAHHTMQRWLISRSDPLIASTLERAAKAGRILPVPSQHEIRLATLAGNGTSDYGSSVLIRATIGDLREPYARFLANHGRTTGHEWFLAPEKLHQLGLDEHQVEVRRVGVGGFKGIGHLDADGLCTTYGYARGVRTLQQ